MSPLGKAGVRDSPVRTAVDSRAYSRRDEAEREEAAAVRWAAHSGSSFSPKCRVVVFVQGQSLRQLARLSGRSGRHPPDTGKGGSAVAASVAV